MADGEQEQGGQGGGDTSALEARMGELAGRVDEIHEAVSGAGDPEPEYGVYGDPYVDPSYANPYGLAGDPGYGQPPYGQPAIPAQVPPDPYAAQGYPAPYAQPGYQQPYAGAPMQPGMAPGMQMPYGQQMPADPSQMTGPQAQAAIQGLAQGAQPGANPALQQVLAPLTQRLDQLEQQTREGQLEQGMAAIEERYPEYASEEKATELVQQAYQFFGSIGRPELAESPEAIEMLIKANRADAAAAQEQPAPGQPGFQLESGAGGQPGGGTQDIAAQIVGAGSGPDGQARAFWGV